MNWEQVETFYIWYVFCYKNVKSKFLMKRSDVHEASIAKQLYFLFLSNHKFCKDLADL